MDDKLVELHINKLIQEYSYLKSDEELKKELINANQSIFLGLVNSKLSEQNLSPDNPNPSIKKIEPKIDISGVSENTKIRIKKIYRDIVKKTHPDKIDSDELKDLYLKATEAYEEYNLFELCIISKSLNIKVKLSIDETKTLNELIESKKNDIKKLESSFICLWINSNNDDEKNKLVDYFINKHYK